MRSGTGPAILPPSSAPPSAEALAGADANALTGASSSRRGFVQQVIHDTLSHKLARFGVAWIGLLAFCASFASVIANSHPILLKTDQGWSSPMLRHFDAVDVVLPVVFVTALVLLVT